MSSTEAAPAGTDGGTCPFHSAATTTSHQGCPVSARATDFDVFEGPYQVDPAEALRWSRAQEPVFYSPKLGYWVVSRYDDVKAIFSDNATFSPSIALEKVTPSSAEVTEVLNRYDFAMARTLVNEDEPAHMERRRSLLHSFLPQELVHHEPMVRQLTREYIDRFIHTGHADLVDEMLWEIPLTVALHFLGVPEEDMDTLREYSIAHIVNTWGRPTKDEQRAVAESVGKFWQYAGHVLEKMRRDPSGSGWMEYAIRRQAELPNVITDSYLHSMMAAGIVAAHETTASASANALRLLLEQRDTWEAICADPSLIPNAVEECLRLSGSIVAWRRLVMKSTSIGGVKLPAGARLLMVMASANHDERHFENPDELDIYRDNTTEHLSFGYGSHQCMGKNLARMEMRIFLEEFARRLPHMELVSNQTFTYLPNTSFRGPEHLLVRWDPLQNPERKGPNLMNNSTSFPIGAPSRHNIARQLQLVEIHTETEDIVRLTLKDPVGRRLPGWTAGAHIDLIAGEYVRKYSLCGDPARSDVYEIAIRKDVAGRGGSVYFHKALRLAAHLQMRGPRNFFRLDETADRYLLIAGGIGITPILAMADRLKEIGKPFMLHYAGRTLESMAFVSRLQRDHGPSTRFYAGLSGDRMDIEHLFSSVANSTPIYACGPDRLLTHVNDLTQGTSQRVHIERFVSRLTQHDLEDEQPFEVELQDSRLTVHVPADQTLLHALRAVGVDVPSDCEEGLCGSCEVRVIDGEVDHRDEVLTAVERATNSRMMACCSRARNKKLVLAL